MTTPEPTRVLRAPNSESLRVQLRKKQTITNSTRRMRPLSGIRLVPPPPRHKPLEERVDRLEISLNDLSSAWIDALDEWQGAQRSGAVEGSAEWQRLQEIEKRLRALAAKQQSVGHAFEAAIENAVEL